MSTAMKDSKLFQPLKVGNNILSNRIALAPLTRVRASDDHVPLPMATEYYTQRAATPGTLLITEATFIAEGAGGLPNVPGIHNQDQINQWKEVTKSVHEKGGVIFCQLWAIGRAASPDALGLKSGHRVVSSSNLSFEGGAKPEALTEEEILQIIKDYAQAAKNAMEAGFDGVEIHGANGYLIDQFTQNTCNNRTDAWGGSVENRCRFGLEVTKAVVAAVGKERTGMRLSPYSDFQGMKMETKDLEETFTYMVSELKKLEIVYLHLTEARIAGNAPSSHHDTLLWILKIWDNQSPVLVSGGYTGASAKDATENEYKDYDVIIVFGRYFISNPDLVEKVRNEIEFRPYNRELFYTPKSPKGYTDYEAHAPGWKASKEHKSMLVNTDSLAPKPKKDEDIRD